MKLVTVAAFSDSIAAELARNSLVGAGIDAILADENIVSMVAPYQIAIGGIKVQVRDEDEEVARAALAEIETEPIDEAELEQAALAEAPEALPEDDHAEGLPVSEELNGSEVLAQRALRGALIGILFPPLQLFVLWMIFNAMTSNEDVRPRYYCRAVAAMVIALFMLNCLFLAYPLLLR